MNEFEEVEEGKLNPGLQAYLDKKKVKNLMIKKMTKKIKKNQ